MNSLPKGPGETRAFCEAEYGRLAGYCLALTGDEQLARDITQEAFLRVLSRWAGLSQSRPYLYVTATNLARKAGRRSAAERFALDQTASIAREAHDPLELAWVRDMTQRLPGHLRAVTVLYYFAGLSISEIALGLHLPPGTVKRRLHDARRQLRIDADYRRMAEVSERELLPGKDR